LNASTALETSILGVLSSVNSGIGGGAVWTPALWFLASEQGIWLDPSDMSTLFQDSAGTTPVTAVEQPVGLALDKRLGLVLSATDTGTDFSSATGWTLPAGFTISGGKLNLAAVATGSAQRTGGTLYLAGKVYEATVVVDSLSGGTISVVFANVGQVISAPGTYTFRRNGAANNYLGLVVATGTVTAVIDSITVRELPGNHASQPTTAQKPVLSARKNLMVRTDNLTHSSWAKTNVTVVGGVADPIGGNTAFTITATANGAELTQGVLQVFGCSSIWIRRRTGSGAVTGFKGNGYIAYAGLDATWKRITIAHEGVRNTQYTIVNLATSGDAVDVWCPQVEDGSAVATTYQRVTTNTDYDTVGFPHYLKFDGVDDSLSVASSNWSATDKLTAVFACSTRGTGNQGVFYLNPNANALYMANATPRMRGSLGGSGGPAQIYVDGQPMGAAGVYTQQYDIAGAAVGDEVKIRYNGTVPTQNVQAAGPAGTGNMSATATLSIGDFSSFKLSGDIYQLVLRGAFTADVTPGEAFFATKL